MRLGPSAGFVKKASRLLLCGGWGGVEKLAAETQHVVGMCAPES